MDKVSDCNSKAMYPMQFWASKQRMNSFQGLTWKLNIIKKIIKVLHKESKKLLQKDFKNYEWKCQN
jgi:hypothetical protein